MQGKLRGGCLNKTRQVFGLDGVIIAQRPDGRHCVPTLPRGCTVVSLYAR